MPYDSILRGLKLCIEEIRDPGTQPELNYSFIDTASRTWALARIKAFQQSGFGGELAFETNTGTGTPSDTTTERMRIDHKGNVGIGKTNPGFMLDVNGVINATEIYRNGAPLSTSQWTTVAAGIHYSGGNVGIGTTQPSAKLNLDPKGAGGIVIGNPNTGSGGFTSLALGISAASGGYSSLQSIQASGTAWGNIILNGSGGNVGVGTTTPRAKLEVAGGTIMPAAGNSESAGLLFPKDPGGGGGDAAWMRYYARTGEATTLEIGISNDPDDHIALMASGGVGIGTVTPVNKLDVNGDIAIRGKHAFRGSDTWLRLNQDGAFPSGVHTPGVFAPVSLNVGGAGGWGNPGSGNVWITGNVGIGTNTLGARLEIKSPWSDWIFLRQQRSTGGDGGFHIHNPWKDTDGADRNRLEIAYRTAAGQDLWGQFVLHGPSGNVGIGTANPVAKLNVAGAIVTSQTHTIKIGVPSPKNRYGNDGIRGEPNLWLDAEATVYIKPGFQTPSGFDIAERFKTLDAVEPAQVVVFDEEAGAVKLCDREGDNHVIGIASAEPAFILGMDEQQVPIALCGRVLCKVDADIAPIMVGDLLTTSPTRGHAQKVVVPDKSAGAIIGKALGALAKGKGEIMVLVLLQ